MLWTKTAPLKRMELANDCSMHWKPQTNCGVEKVSGCRSKHGASWNRRRAPWKNTRNTEATQKPNADCNREGSNVNRNAVNIFSWKNWNFLNFLSSVHHQVLLYNTWSHWILQVVEDVLLRACHRPQGWGMSENVWNCRQSKLFSTPVIAKTSPNWLPSVAQDSARNSYVIQESPSEHRCIQPRILREAIPQISKSLQPDSTRRHFGPETPPQINCEDVACHPLRAKFQNRLGSRSEGHGGKTAFPAARQTKFQNCLLSMSKVCLALRFKNIGAKNEKRKVLLRLAAWLRVYATRSQCP